MGFEELCQDLERFRPPADLVDNVVVVERVGSTNRLARRIVGEYAGQELSPPEYLLVAGEQRQGRGRQGRSWASPPGAGVYATMVVHRQSVEQCARLPLQVAVGLVEALDDVLASSTCRLKWPNDLVTATGKLGGILIETLAVPDEGRRVALVGFGINRGLGARDDDLPAAGATSLWRELGREPPSLGELTWKLVRSVHREIRGLGDEGEGSGLVERYRRLSAHEPGQNITCRLGDETLEGTFRGFDECGFLRLERDGRVRTVAAGEVLE